MTVEYEFKWTSEQLERAGIRMESAIRNLEVYEHRGSEVSEVQWLEAGDDGRLYLVQVRRRPFSC